MAAEAALSFAVEKLGDVVIQKVSFLLDVGKQVTQLQDDLKNMQRFLKDAAEKQADDNRIRGWISDIREVAHDSEDVIETFVLKVDAPQRRRGLFGWCGWFPKHVYNLDRLGKEIQAIRNRLKKIDKNRSTFGIRNLDEGSGSSKRLETVERRRRMYPWETDKHVVGLEGDVEALITKVVLDEKEGLKVASIVGMPGSGKSTLAKKLYNHAAAGERYERRAWVCVSREFRPKEVMKDMVMQLLKREENLLKEALDIMEKSPESQVQSKVHELLKDKHYFIVVDDVWRQGDWEYLAKAFPDQQGKTSRVLVTSRIHNIPRGARYVHEHNGLGADKSWELLMKVALVDNDDGKCPPELEDIGRKILEKCNGLPLAITVMGGLLQDQRQSKSGWEKVLRDMSSYLGRNDDSVLSILELSYHDLPPHLKSCFLCLSFFKEDATIPVRELTQVWIAEGFIHQEVGEEETMEEIARSHLDELINRNMVQVKDSGKDATMARNCHVHDLLHDLSIRKAEEEIKFKILKASGDSESLENSTDSKSMDKFRHCAIYSSNEGSVSLGKNQHLRSLFLYGSKANLDGIPSDHWKSFEILRLLELEGFGLVTLPESICTLIALRHLGLKDNKLKKLPESLGLLKNLQILDLLGNRGMEVPNIIWQLVSLRHLHIEGSIIVGEPLKLDTLKKLQTLAFVWTDRIVVEHLAELTSLCKLGIGLKEGIDLSKLYASMSKLKKLISIDISFDDGAFVSADGFGSLQHLTRFKVRYPLPKLPSANDFPQNLSYVSLIRTELNEDPMPKLEWLPNLLYLKLFQGVEYEVADMVISPGGFPMLRELHLEDMYFVEKIQIGESGMLKLKRLNIKYCGRIKILPEQEEMRLMSNLQELKMLWVSSENISKLQDVRYSQIFSSIPSVEIDHAYNY